MNHTNDALLMSVLRGLTAIGWTVLVYNFLCIVISQTFFESQVISQSFFESQVISQFLLSLIAVVNYILNTTPTSSKLSYAHGRGEGVNTEIVVCFLCVFRNLLLKSIYVVLSPSQKIDV